jgi:protein arginine kinase activator
MHMCEECGNNPANIHLTQIVDNQTMVYRLCEGCAKKKGISISIEMPQAEMGTIPQVSEQEEAVDSGVVCSRCDLSLAEFKEKGWLGCSSCYEAFADEIDGLLLRVHGSHVHKGKRYRSAPVRGLGERDMQRLRKEMELAIRSEKFELAAAIRDKIKGASPVEFGGGGEAES